jgi:hypothetical protein
MKKQSFSLLVDSIRNNNIDSLLQLLVNAKIRVISKLIRKAVIMVEADRVLDEKDQFDYEVKWAQIENDAEEFMQNVPLSGAVAPINEEGNEFVSITHPPVYKIVAQRVSERLNDEVTENTVRYYLGLA